MQDTGIRLITELRFEVGIKEIKSCSHDDRSHPCFDDFLSLLEIDGPWLTDIHTRFFTFSLAEKEAAL
jgi:hypothetical protein